MGAERSLPGVLLTRLQRDFMGFPQMEPTGKRMLANFWLGS